ncbi:MAG: isoprenylcysteine carboxylmethyltransferase family protein [Rhizobiales bacterium]|nr:isoprenylcysteine carboxylmethyltransferase family protein [Hyphomicrobiales bacterium]OJY44445.1 MAG: hypothetical protein BGP08_13515 [Rhizobiales bacterium 64-17]
MIATFVIRTFIWIGCIAALLFVPAGTWRWPAAWVLLALMLVFSFGFGAILLKHDPALLNERMKSIIQPEQKRWDKILLLITFPLLIVWIVVIALDAARYHLSAMPLIWQIAGALCVAIANGVGFLVMLQNSYAAPVVKIQKERGQRAVDTGLYAHVRHPMYAGALLFFIGLPLLLGSWYGLLFFPVFTGLFAIRAVLEERTLIRELDGYADYATRVRYRLIPGVW